MCVYASVFVCVCVQNACPPYWENSVTIYLFALSKIEVSCINEMFLLDLWFLIPG